jgi:hypothetical protein
MICESIYLEHFQFHNEEGIKELKKELNALMLDYATQFIRSTTARLPNKALLSFISLI